jgi:DNA mismatch repair protein MutL
MTDPLGASERRPIRHLAPSVIGRIAAGEVVERPASVVKELCENAADAGARFVTIEIEHGGLERIAVSDDGGGIPRDELPLAVERHATSKLPPEGPIDRIGTLGFRGEALAAIATVARLRLVSRTPDREVGSGITVDGGERGPDFEVARSPGTTVEVRDLFYRTPARRKFLKSPAAEQIEVLRTAERLYLARPAIGLAVVADGRELARYPSARDLADAAARVLGPELLSQGCDVDEVLPDGSVRGVVGRPAVAAPTSRRLFFAINGRAVESRPLVQAIRLAYGDLLPRTRYPVGVIHLELDPERIDANVHPTKRTVRVARERDLEDAVRRAVRVALLAAPQLADRTRDRGPPGSAIGRPSPPAGTGLPSTELRPGLSLQRTLGEPDAAAPRPSVPGTPRHPPLTLLGCLDALYWVASSEEGVVLVDQHAASERVVFDALHRPGALGRQSLVEPFTVRLSATQLTALRAHAESVRASGFDVEPFGPDSVRVRSVPTVGRKRADADAVRALLDELADGGRPTVPDERAERVLATIACHASIRAGDAVSVEEFARVLAQLYALPEAAYACPHGRPIAVRIPRGRLDRWFLRSGA